jgi:hypothetical protein
MARRLFEIQEGEPGYFVHPRTRARKKREQPVMGSSKNVNAGTGRGTTQFKKDKPKRDTSKNTDGMSTTYGPLTTPGDISTAPPMNTAGIAGLPGSPSGMSEEREAASGRTTFFGPTPEDAVEMAAEAPRMRKGLFGEDIPEEEYLEMERKNREAGFFGRFKKGGSVKKATKKYASGGSVSSASKRGDGCATKGKTRGRMV